MSDTKTELPTIEEPRAARCETCRHWEQCSGLTNDIADGDMPDRAKYGWCHRFPPSPYGEKGNARQKLGRTPATCETDWCGEWQAKRQPSFAESCPADLLRQWRAEFIAKFGPNCESVQLYETILRLRGEPLE